MNFKKLSYKLSVVVISVFMCLTLIKPIFADNTSDDIQKFNRQMEIVNELDLENSTFVQLREPITYAATLYTHLDGTDKEKIEQEVINQLYEDQAIILNLWIEELLPLDSYADSGMSWVIDDQYEALSDVLEEKKLSNSYQITKSLTNFMILLFQNYRKRNAVIMLQL